MAVSIIYNLHITLIKCLSSYSQNAHNSKFSVFEDTFQLTVTYFQNGTFSRALIWYSGNLARHKRNNVCNKTLFKIFFLGQVNVVAFLFSSSLYDIIIPYWKLSHIGNIYAQEHPYDGNATCNSTILSSFIVSWRDSLMQCMRINIWKPKESKKVCNMLQISENK